MRPDLFIHATGAGLAAALDWVDHHAGLAGWAQAIGTILAIMAAGRSSRLHLQQAAQGRTQAAVTSLKTARGSMGLLLINLDKLMREQSKVIAAEGPELMIAARTLKRVIDDVGTVARQIDTTSLPSIGSEMAIIELQSWARKSSDQLADALGGRIAHANPDNPDARFSYRDMTWPEQLTALRTAIDDIYSESQGVLDRLQTTTLSRYRRIVRRPPPVRRAS